MTDPNLAKIDETATLDLRLAAVLDQYMADRRRGKAPDHDQVLAEHPDLADELRSCLEGIDLIGEPLAAVAVDGNIGDFELGPEIGRGGMGVVFKAHQKSLDRTVALKILNLPLNAPKVMERFQREAAMAAGLHHTNIVPIYEVGVAGGTHYYAMQLIDGLSLAEVMRDKKGPLDPDDVANWGLQAADALAHAHAHGVIHRDIKPSNLILDPEQRIWLTDFGLARRMDDVKLSVTGAVLGTPRYMSPEQAATISAPVDERTDIYSLGATLYELACGQPAVTGDNPVAVISSIMNDNRCSPRVHRPELSRDLETILMRCLEKHPTDRYPDAQTLASDLRALTEHRPIASRPVSVVEKSRRWIKQHSGSMQWAASGGFVAIILLCVGLWIALVMPRLDDASVQLSTTSAGMRADFEPMDGDTTPFSVAIPAADPIVLDAGKWRARLIEPGTFSHSVQHRFEGGDDRAIMLPPPPPPLWSVDDVITSKPVKFDDGTDMIIATSKSIERRDATTGDLIWSRPMQELTLWSARSVKIENLQWGGFPDGPKTMFQPSPICVIGQSNNGQSDRAKDINDDGHPDILLASFTKPAIVALSGADGSTLWTKEYSKQIGTHLSSNGHRCAWIDTLGHTTLDHTVNDADTDNDTGSSLPQPIAIFTTSHGNNLAHVVEFDAASGEPNWHHPVRFRGNARERETIPFRVFDNVRQSYFPSHRTWHQQYTYIDGYDHSPSWLSLTHAAPYLTADSRSQLLCTTDGSVTAIDRASGESTVRLALTKSSAVGAIQPVTTDGGKRCFLVAAQTSGIQSRNDREQLTLRLMSEDFAQQHWTRTVRADPYSSVSRWTDRPTVPLVADLNHDGSDEMVIQTDRSRVTSEAFHVGSVWAELQVIDSNGNDLLATPLRIPTCALQLMHVQIVDDQDGDGWDDLAVASRYLAPRDDRGVVHIESFGSKSGQLLWHQTLRHQHAGKHNSPPFIHQFQRSRVGKRELLFLQTVGESGFYDDAHVETAIIDPRDGSIVSVGSQLSLHSIVNPETDDPSSSNAAVTDGAMLWCGHHAPSAIVPSNNPLGKSFKMLAMPSENTLHVSESVTMADDIDGDATADLLVQRVSRGVQTNPEFVSGATGERLGSHESGRYGVKSIGADLTGNGKNDFLTWNHDQTLELIEGRTRDSKWTLSERIFTSEAMIAAIPAALTSDQTNDLIVATYAEHATKPTFGMAPWLKPLLVIGIRGSDGKVLWMKDYGPPVESARREQLPFTFTDLNNDRRTDFVFGYFNNLKAASLFAIDGSSGEQIWEIPNIYAGSPFWLSHFPSPVAIGTADQPKKIAMIDADSSSKGFYLTIRDAITGGNACNVHFASRYHSYSALGRRWGHHSITQLKTPDASEQRIVFWIFNSNLQLEIHVGNVESGEYVPSGKPWIVAGDQAKTRDRWTRFFAILPVDVDQDGFDDLIMNSVEGISAFRTDGTEIWSHEVEGAAAVDWIRSVGNASDSGTRECIVRVAPIDPASGVSFNEVIAIEIADGTRRWQVKSEPGMSLVNHMSRDHELSMLDPDATLPTIVFADALRHNWVAKTASAATDAIQPDITPRRTIVADVVDMRMLGSGPYPRENILFNNRWKFAGRTLWAALWSLFVFVIPIVLVIRAIVRRQFSLMTMLIATAVVAACIALLTVPVSNQAVPISARLTMGFWMTPFFVWPALIVAFYRRGNYFGSVTLLVAPFALVLGYEAFKLAISDPQRIALASDVLRLWRGWIRTIVISVLLGAPLWIMLWFRNRMTKFGPRVNA